MSLVEESEKNGFKSKNIVSAILDRLKISKVEFATLKLGDISRERLGTTNPEKSLQRWAKDGAPVWLFIDDIDQNFQNTPDHKLKVSSFLVACREMVNSVNRLCIRITIRPNVWTILKLEYEALSHVEQYTRDLQWSEDAILQMLAKRIEGYLKRKNYFSAISAKLPKDPAERDKALVSEVFLGPMAWGKIPRAPHVVVYTLSKHRPRWAIELSKVAANSADTKGRSNIWLEDIVQNLEAFGSRRITDTVAEFRSQCAEIDELISAFARGQEEYRTDDLLKLIENKVLSHLAPRISGVPGKASARDVAAFLFEAGVFYGKRVRADESYEHISFSEQPTLWRSRADMDRGLVWEIHPVFRQALEIRDSTGREFAPPDRKRKTDRRSR